MGNYFFQKTLAACLQSKYNNESIKLVPWTVDLLVVLEDQTLDQVVDQAQTVVINLLSGLKKQPE